MDCVQLTNDQLAELMVIGIDPLLVAIAVVVAGVLGCILASLL